MSIEPSNGDRGSVGAESAELARINALLQAEIEQRRRAEAVLRQSEERFAKAFRSSPDALVINRLSDGAFMEVNHSWERLVGYEAAEVLGKNRQSLPLAADTLLRDQLNQRLASDGSFRDQDIRLRQRSGAIRDMRVSAETIELGGEVCVIARLRDITEQKEAERALRASDERLHMALAAAKMAICEWIIPENRLVWSAEAASIFALPNSETPDTPEGYLALVHPDDRAVIARSIAEIIGEPGRAQESYSSEHRILWPTGETRWLATKGLKFFQANGVPVRAVGTLIDMTERKEADEKAQRYLTGLWRMARIKTADQMASSLAHELNQPLTAIAIQAGIASSLVSADSDRTSPDLKMALQEIHEQAQRAGGIIRSLRDLIKKGDSRRSLVPLSDVVREVVNLIEGPTRQNHVSVNLSLPELPPVAADRIQIAQILMNLFQNAIEAMQERAVGQRRLEVETALDGRAVLLSVRDTGSGIAPEIGDAVFDSFYTTKTEGIGVGLAICRSIADAHGAKLWFTSEQGVGTAFHLRMPVAGVEETGVTEKPAASPKPTIFVVDDDPAVCRAIATGISRLLGLSVNSFATAEEFLADFDPERPGCLILDVRMPGIGGLELQQILRQRGSLLPIIMISGHAQVHTAVTAMRNGALNLLEKPFDMEQLEEQVRHALEIDAQTRDKARRREAINARIAALTAREREIMDLLIGGKTNKEISLALGVSIPTVDKHRWKVLEKMSVENVVELVHLLSDSGL